MQSPEMQPPSPAHRSGSRPPPSLSCVACRRRKIKCDHRRPICSGCEKYADDCVWPERKKNAQRKDKRLYEHVVDRLAQMERLVQELQRPQPSLVTQPSPSSPSSHASSTGPSDAQSSSVGGTSMSFSPSPSSPRKPYYSGAASEATIGTAGSCSLFSAEGIKKIDSLVGDRRFSSAVLGLLQKIRRIPSQRSLGLDLESSFNNHPFPPNNVIMECMNNFFLTMNHDIKLFQESEVRAAVQAYIYGRSPQGSGWKMALNVILLHSLRKRDWVNQTGEYEKYLHNALSLIPSAIMQTPSPLTIGALLSLTFYFVFTAENHIAVSILAVATQLILLSGYHHGDHPSLPGPEILHRRRLFWQAYVLDHDLMLRIGKPPLIADDLLLDLPEEHPADGYGVFFYPGDVALNYFRQQLVLSRIQGRICARLYFGGPATTKMTDPALEAEIAALDAELQEWRAGIPEMIRPAAAAPPTGLVDADYSRMMSLSGLHFVYFQLVVAVHSAAFRLQDRDAESLRGPSVAVCVNAARGAISLLNYHQLQHPFTIYLLYQVAWCVDILFVNILENKSSVQSVRDLELIAMVLSFFERYDANHQSVASYHIIRALYGVASSAVAQSPSDAGGGGGGVADPVPTLSLSDLELGGWEEISLGSHEWLSAGFLQMTDWRLPTGADGDPEQDDDYLSL
ncbi:hypothetical protein EsH8_V_000673 [Colletotrichum jinshuiense]